MALLRTLYYTAFLLIFVSALFSEVEGRRKILRGRKTITRHYYQKPLLPAWAKILLVGIFLLIAGGITYVVAYKIVMRDSNTIVPHQVSTEVH